LIPSGDWDVVVIGAGAAGLMTCLELPRNLKVLLLNKNIDVNSSSRWAQGGMASVTRPEDSFQSHIQDTINAGAGLCDRDAVNLMVNEAPKCVERLLRLGMNFDKDFDSLATTLEAAHSFRRVLHVQDRTGGALLDVLGAHVDRQQNISQIRGVEVTQLWVESNACYGVQVFHHNRLYWIASRAVVVATGGGGHLYANTTNPPQACGEGISLAWRAGAVLEDLEFIQFHPTALRLKGAPCFLITEALRGEGAVLKNKLGVSPLGNLPGKDLAPRDQLSRALVECMDSEGIDFINLDVRAIAPEKFQKRFPNILRRCMEFGLDPYKTFIPVAPAAHYWMGGIATDMNAATSIKGLYAVGEVACTGLHGANRLASNSLMECLVFAKQMSNIELNHNMKVSGINNNLSSEDFNQYYKDSQYKLKDLKEKIEYLRDLCWDKVGVNRAEKGMRFALSQINQEDNAINNDQLLELLFRQNKDSILTFKYKENERLRLLLDLSNRKLVSSLLLKAAIFRKESRGGHHRKDFPQKSPFWECHSSQKKGANISTRPIKT
tara:strand:+ start:27645 stop:29294 length:1650 start_codon:yes stop_codon:yes gene_type:complete